MATRTSKEVTNAQIEVLHQMREAIENESTMRRSLYKMFLDRRRNIEEECGYPETEELDANTYKQLYAREPVAARIVNLFPNHCWQVSPNVYETEDMDEETPFEAAWVQLARDLRGPGFFKEEEGLGNPIWECLERLDRLTGIGRYGALLLGVDDGAPLSEPLELLPRGGTTQSRKLLYLRPLDETLAAIADIERDSSNRRCGLPTVYDVQLSGTDTSVGGVSISGTSTSVASRVHWTRIIHVADLLESSEVYGVSRLQTVYNRVYDLYKLYGGSAEMYWLAAFFGVSLETHPQLGGDVTIDVDNVKRQLENFQNTLQRWLAIPGMTAKTLAPQVSSPLQHIDVQLEALCIHLGVPKRIFLGSERGELASGQDARSWYSTIRHRQNAYVTPRLIVPFVDRLIQIGILPAPMEYCVDWPDIALITDQERADLALKRTDAMAKYVQGNVESLIDPLDYLTRVIGFSAEEADEILEARATTDMDLFEEEEPEPEPGFGEQVPPTGRSAFEFEDGDEEPLAESGT